MNVAVLLYCGSTEPWRLKQRISGWPSKKSCGVFLTEKIYTLSETSCRQCCPNPLQPVSAGSGLITDRLWICDVWSIFHSIAMSAQINIQTNSRRNSESNPARREACGISKAPTCFGPVGLLCQSMDCGLLLFSKPAFLKRLLDSPLFWNT